MRYLGLPESAITDVPEMGGRENVLAEFFRVEKAWLVALADAGGLAKNRSPTRAVRLLVRWAIANRDLFPVKVDVDPATPWLADVAPLRDRLEGWLDSLPDDVLVEIERAVKLALARRK